MATEQGLTASLPAPLHGSSVVQVAYHVDDVREAARRWHELTGVGPFFVQEHVPLLRASSGGVDLVFDQTCAVAQWGEVMLELVQVHAIDPPELRSTVVPYGVGLHHVAVMVDDLERSLDELRAHGCRVVLDAETARVRFAFVDPGPELGHLLECYEAVPYLQKLYAAVRRAAVGWDGDRLFV